MGRLPTAAHVGMSWIMAYDLEPLVTLQTKETWLTRAGEEGWRIVFCHDRDVVSARALPGRHGVGCEIDDLINEKPDETSDEV